MLQRAARFTSKVVGASVLEPHPQYRTAIGVLGVALPVVLLGAERAVQGSISAYYYTPMRDWFVGTLWVIGVFLFFYQYTPVNPELAQSSRPAVKSGWADACLGKVAGVCAVCVALFPTAPPTGSGAEPPVIGIVHGTAAGVLFFFLSLFPLVLFSQSRDRVLFYKACGWTMILCLILIGVYALGPESLRHSLSPLRPVFVLEWVLIWAFGFSWFAKGLGSRPQGASLG